jgi:hypothetical protein
MSNRPNQSYLGKVFLIAWREFRYTALTKGFIFGAVAMPVLMFGVIAEVAPVGRHDRCRRSVGHHRAPRQGDSRDADQ